MIQHFEFQNKRISGLVEITPFFADDNRGYFIKDFEKDIFTQNGISFDIYEEFNSFSYKNVIRGLHFQSKYPQSKLISALQGEIFDVAVDLRKDSPTFGEWEAVILSERNRKSFLIPKGFAHGFAVLSETAVVSYKCEGKYLKEYDTGIVWNDLSLNIKWPDEVYYCAIVSERDKDLQSFEEFRIIPI